jgi:hypothetical protein
MQVVMNGKIILQNVWVYLTFNQIIHMRFTINLFNSENSQKIELIIGVENHKKDFPWCDFYQTPPIKPP